MNFKLFLLSILLFQSAIGQQNMFQESSESLAHHFEYANVLANSSIKDRYDELTRSEGFVVNQVTYSGSSFTKRLHHSGKVFFNCPAGVYLNQLKSHLLSDYPDLDKLIHVYITEDASLNAFATVNNNIYVNIGLLTRVENEAQLAFILSHEIMHIVNEHLIKGTLKLQKEASSYDKSNIAVNNDIFELRKHELSRENETQADLDGFELFLKTTYDALEGVKALEMLEKANDFTIDFTMSQELFFLSSNEIYSNLIKKYKDFYSKYSRNREGKVDSLPYLTHPLLSVRIDQMAEIMKSIPADKNDGIQYLVSETDFKELKKQATELVNQIYADELDFISLFLNSSARYHTLGDTSENNLNFIAYSLQGLLFDRYKHVQLGEARSTNIADSVLSHFYKTSTDQEFSTWIYATIDEIATKHPSEKSKRYYDVITKLISKHQTTSLDTIFGSDYEQLKTISADTVGGLNIDEISFEVTPYSDLSIFKVSKFNDYKKVSKEVDGKLAVVGMTNIHIRREKFMGKHILDIPKMATTDKRSDVVFDNIETDFTPKVTSLLPNPKEYSGDDYVHYDQLNLWLSERMYFTNESFVSIHEDDIKKIMQECDVKYAFSSINVGVKSFSFKTFLAAYFSPFVMPIYLPGMIMHVANSSTRKYQLSLIYNLESGELVFWDKRTYLEPNSIGQLQMINTDIFNNFFNE